MQKTTEWALSWLKFLLRVTKNKSIQSLLSLKKQKLSCLNQSEFTKNKWDTTKIKVKIKVSRKEEEEKKSLQMIFVSTQFLKKKLINKKLYYSVYFHSKIIFIKLKSRSVNNHAKKNKVSLPTTTTKN